jgi:hypothetical protein
MAELKEKIFKPRINVLLRPARVTFLATAPSVTTSRPLLSTVSFHRTVNSDNFFAIAQFSITAILFEM